MRALIALALAFSGVAVAIAASPEIQGAPLDAEARAPLPQVEVDRGVTYLNGGAGLGEVAYFKSRAGEFPLQIIFSGRGGEYTVAERVTIRNGDRVVVSVPDAGPYLMLQLPRGRYAVEAVFNGAVESRSVTVGGGVSKVNWNSSKASN